MVRLLGILVGLGFVMAGLFSLFTTPLSNEANMMEEYYKKPRHLALSSDGVFAKWDQHQLQRGLQVYKEVCSACHGLSQVAFRDIKALGYDDGQVKTFAAGFQVPSINAETGEAATREGLASDKFPSPYANDIAARAANNGAVPPDLSLITKAREDGKNYLYSLLTGYTDPPKGMPKSLMPTGALHHNPYFHSLNLAMAKPLSDGQVTFADGSKNDVEHMARDVAAFLVWTAEPKLVDRIALGRAVIGFLLMFTVLAYLSYRNIWADKKH